MILQSDCIISTNLLLSTRWAPKPLAITKHPHPNPHTSASVPESSGAGSRLLTTMSMAFLFWSACCTYVQRDASSQGGQHTSPHQSEHVDLVLTARWCAAKATGVRHQLLHCAKALSEKLSHPKLGSRALLCLKQAKPTSKATQSMVAEHSRAQSKPNQQASIHSSKKHKMQQFSCTMP